MHTSVAPVLPRLVAPLSITSTLFQWMHPLALHVQVPDPVMQLACLDASLAMRPVFAKYQVRWVGMRQQHKWHAGRPGNSFEHSGMSRLRHSG
jgi:hypothetical protein